MRFLRDQENRKTREYLNGNTFPKKREVFWKLKMSYLDTLTIIVYKNSKSKKFTIKKRRRHFFFK